MKPGSRRVPTVLSRRAARVLRLGLALGVLGNGCAGGLRSLDREDLTDPAPARYYLVTTRTGETRTFISLHLEGDTLFGTERITTEITEGAGEEKRTSVWNRYEETQIPWNRVLDVQAELKEKTDLGVYLAAGALVLGAATFIVLSQIDDEEPPDDGGGKVP